MASFSQLFYAFLRSPRVRVELNGASKRLTRDSNPCFVKLVGGVATPLKNMKVNWDDYNQYMGK